MRFPDHLPHAAEELRAAKARGERRVGVIGKPRSLHEPSQSDRSVAKHMTQAGALTAALLAGDEPVA